MARISDYEPPHSNNSNNDTYNTVQPVSTTKYINGKFHKSPIVKRTRNKHNQMNASNVSHSLGPGAIHNNNNNKNLGSSAFSRGNNSV